MVDGLEEVDSFKFPVVNWIMSLMVFECCPIAEVKIMNWIFF